MMTAVALLGAAAALATGCDGRDAASPPGGSVPAGSAPHGSTATAQPKTAAAYVRVASRACRQANAHLPPLKLPREPRARLAARIHLGRIRALQMQTALARIQAPLAQRRHAYALLEANLKLVQAYGSIAKPPATKAALARAQKRLAAGERAVRNAARAARVAACAPGSP